MNTIVLEEALRFADLFPFNLTRPAWDIRLGILTFREKWELAEHAAAGAPDPIAMDKILSLARGIQHAWELIHLNAAAIADDFALLTRDRSSQPIPGSVQTVSPENIFIEKGARISHSILNASTGPIYIGKNAEIMEGSTIRGPLALCEGSVIKMGSKIYGATTIGPFSMVGGEIKNSVIFGYSNKGHDGYLGDSVIGEWCNLGAGTSNSNLKNNASEIKVWSPGKQQFIGAGLKCGLLMGDYSRCSINTSFNTGTLVGVCCQILGGSLTPKYIPSFSWANNPAGHPASHLAGHPAAGQHDSPFSKYEFDKAILDIANWKKLKGQSMNEKEIQVLRHIFDDKPVEQIKNRL
jgi:UDP-N-acetylglucosamine diphosphorylase / glucose-1-phosphate thymidylyltransferase / UDP-N-acetylgalactosamine diphosphorylase / glucosamine-1-phosphate N-acetyltransferase / galactosamine-1-phosphate N-acetyltransferase